MEAFVEAMLQRLIGYQQRVMLPMSTYSPMKHFGVPMAVVTSCGRNKGDHRCRPVF